jgi:hypothetical protein
MLGFVSPSTVRPRRKKPPAHRHIHIFEYVYTARSKVSLYRSVKVSQLFRVPPSPRSLHQTTSTTRSGSRSRPAPRGPDRLRRSRGLASRVEWGQNGGVRCARARSLSEQRVNKQRSTPVGSVLLSHGNDRKSDRSYRGPILLNLSEISILNTTSLFRALEAAVQSSPTRRSFVNKCPHLSPQQVS